MMDFSDIKWVFPWAFLGLLLLGWLVYVRYRSQKSAPRYGVPGPVKKKAYASWRTYLVPYLPIVLIVSLALAIIALANPQKTDSLQKVTTEGIDIYLVMDLSHSMLEKDFDPSRIAVAKRVAKEFVKSRPHDRIGLVPFGRVAFTQCPLTMDHQVVLKLIDKMKARMLGDNTAIGMGIATAVSRLKESKSKSKIIILLTDGKNNVNEVDPITAAQLAAQFDIKVYTIGMSKPIMRRLNLSRQSLHSLNVDENQLREIANITGGKYYRATSGDALEKIYDEIGKLETTEMELTLINRADLKYNYFLIPAFILLFLWFLLSRTILKTFLP